jgi:hypothetical protein
LSSAAPSIGAMAIDDVIDWLLDSDPALRW